MKINEINRRDVIKGIGATAASAVLPKLPISKVENKWANTIGGGITFDETDTGREFIPFENMDHALELANRMVDSGYGGAYHISVDDLFSKEAPGFGEFKGSVPSSVSAKMLELDDEDVVDAMFDFDDIVMVPGEDDYKDDEYEIDKSKVNDEYVYDEKNDKKYDIVIPYEDDFYGRVKILLNKTGENTYEGLYVKLRYIPSSKLYNPWIIASNNLKIQNDKITGLSEYMEQEKFMLVTKLWKGHKKTINFPSQTLERWYQNIATITNLLTTLKRQGQPELNVYDVKDKIWNQVKDVMTSNEFEDAVKQIEYKPEVPMEPIKDKDKVEVPIKGKEKTRTESMRLLLNSLDE